MSEVELDQFENVMLDYLRGVNPNPLRSILFEVRRIFSKV